LIIRIKFFPKILIRMIKSPGLDTSFRYLNTLQVRFQLGSSTIYFVVFLKRLRFSSKQEGRMQEHFEESSSRKFSEFRYQARERERERVCVCVTCFPQDHRQGRLYQRRPRCSLRRHQCRARPTRQDLQEILPAFPVRELDQRPQDLLEVRSHQLPGIQCQPATAPATHIRLHPPLGPASQSRVEKCHRRDYSAPPPQDRCPGL